MPSVWQPIEQHPPRHRRLAFKTKHGTVFAGAACYGMHAPWWCANRVDGGTDVINDQHEVTHWMLLEDE